MLQVTRFSLLATAVLIVFGTSPAFTSTTSIRGLHALQKRVQQTETELKQANARHASLPSRIAIARKLRLYVAHELEKQRSVQDPDAMDDHLALTLIGFDEDLGSFVDEPSHDFSEAKCAGYKIALIHDYTAAGEISQDREPANLPLHTQKSLDILELLCRI